AAAAKAGPTAATSDPAAGRPPPALATRAAVRTLPAMRSPRASLLAPGICAVLLAWPARAAEVTPLPGVVVTARVESVPAFELPAALDVIDLREDNRARADLAEALGG